MNFIVDGGRRSVSLSAPRGTYSDDAVRIAALVFSGRADIYQRTSRSDHELELVAKRRDIDLAALEAMGGEFLNEMLNQEYRFIVAGFNRKIADLIATQALLSARGGAEPKAHKPDVPEMKMEIRKLMAATKAEIKRSMPKKIAPKGPLYPPESHAR